ncbi:MAG TPA: lysophospholipid acyltransferase family protein [Candidatus Acidoferrales bacterium]|nr:lysophospholipid acyltransferase family protein [Candidatus Acidoferrales bacterium]
MIRTLVLVLFFVLAVILVLPWLVLWSVVAGNPDLMYRLAMKVVRVGNRLGGIRVRVAGLENIPKSACIFAANHVSNIDPLAFIPAIPRRVAILVKQELFRVPIFSTAMRRAQFIPVDRADREAAASSIEAALRSLKEGISFAVFVEGTRSPDGRLRPFKKGAFVMAIEAGVPIVPVSIGGTQRLMRRGSWTLIPGETTVRFGPAVDASEYTMGRRAELLARVEALVAAGLPPDQRSLAQGAPAE